MEKGGGNPGFGDSHSPDEEPVAPTAEPFFGDCYAGGEVLYLGDFG